MHSSIQSRFAPILYVLIFFAGFLAAQVWFNQQAYFGQSSPFGYSHFCRCIGLVDLGCRLCAIQSKKQDVAP